MFTKEKIMLSHPLISLVTASSEGYMTRMIMMFMNGQS